MPPSLNRTNLEHTEFVFEGNMRARKFYEQAGVRATKEPSQRPFHELLLQTTLKLFRL